jgi:hypothetical protein
VAGQIPLIIPSFNQLCYLRQLVNWWRLHRPNDPVIVVDNASDDPALVRWLSAPHEMVEIRRFDENRCVQNLAETIQKAKEHHPFYVISDPDILPHPATPPDFLEILVKLVSEMGFHHAGFNLITNDLPQDLNPGYRRKIINNEALAQGQEIVEVGHQGRKHQARRAAIDTTFALYSSKGSGWHAPMDGGDWSNAVRIFRAFHLQWYIRDWAVPEEMQRYYKSALGPDHGSGTSAGRNNYRPAS